MSRRIDVLPMVAAVIAAGMTLVYVVLIRSQGDRPTWWLVGALVIASLGAAYGARRAAVARRVVLGVAAAILAVLGLLALLTIGLPILVAAVLCLVSVARPEPSRVPVRVD